MVVEVFLLKNIAKDWLGFLPLLRRVSQDSSCVLVHGVSSCDLGSNCLWFKLNTKNGMKFMLKPSLLKNQHTRPISLV
jgi:hypothetical protein